MFIIGDQHERRDALSCGCPSLFSARSIEPAPLPARYRSVRLKVAAMLMFCGCSTTMPLLHSCP